jgi:hypothetical protein
MINVKELEFVVAEYNSAYEHMTKLIDQANAERLKIDEARKKIAELLSIKCM